jgi:hypothetical protein
MYLCVRDIYQARNVWVMYLCVRGTKPGKYGSCICVLGISSQESMGHVFVC